jgi:hypothetical protein
MRTYPTPAPISVSLDVGIGTVTIEAAARQETTVEVRPSNPEHKQDVAAAEQTRVEMNGAVLVVRSPRSRRRFAPWGGRESIDVRIAVPLSSAVDGRGGVVDLFTTGALGNVSFETGMGRVHVEHAEAVRVGNGMGDVEVECAEGEVRAHTGMGDIRCGLVSGSSQLKSGSGAIFMVVAGGEVQARSGNGNIVIDRALTSVSAKSGNGAIRISEVNAGVVEAATGRGEIEIGVRPGVVAQLDLQTGFGKVVSALGPGAPPSPGEPSVTVRGQTGFGTIVLRRSAEPVPAGAGAS